MLRADQKTAKFPQPFQHLQARPPSGAAWRALLEGASRCLWSGRVESAPFRFRSAATKRNMKSIRNVLAPLFILGGFVALFSLLHAQDTATPTQSGVLTATNDVSAMSDLQVEVQAIEMTTPEPASAAPLDGNFYSTQHLPGTENSGRPCRKISRALRFGRWEAISICSTMPTCHTIRPRQKL